ncbi:MAG: substrate-binding domain-containing protein, partial [Huintestinicola sp.]|uniref:substrate-binding domain-containing protein n=1 Tax=Huintestinicola sp. TaxID=2981661 RepID=UPI003EFBEE6B
MKKALCVILSALFSAGIFSSCALSRDTASENSFGGGVFEKETIRILSGSENKELSDILSECSKKTGVGIEMTYKGSVDIMNELKNGAEEYDAVWPASGIWLSLGDDMHIIKHDKSISSSPVVFGIKKSLAENLGFTSGKVSVNDILDAINSGKLSFCMTSATQSNSGASAYIGFLYALTGKTSALTSDDLDSPGLKEKISSLFSGIDRSSGSSDWLKDMFLAGDYDAMVNYESLIIAADRELVSQGREPLYAVYPYDGLTVADSPLAYADHGNKDKEKAFLEVQEYLLSDDVQEKIRQTGRRTGFTEDYSQYGDIFNAQWGIDTEKILSPITMPSEETLMKALALYQTAFRKPSLNIYCLDFSGSMRGEGNSQLVEAMGQILLPENAEKNLLQAAEDEVNIAVIFDGDVRSVYTAEGASEAVLEDLYSCIAAEEPEGGTDMYSAAAAGIEEAVQNYDLSDYCPAVIIMSDGASKTRSREDFISKYNSCGYDIPVFSIMFGDAEDGQLNELAELTNARVFDGRTDLAG